MSIKENIQLIRQRVAKAAQSVGRNPQEIKIIAAAKMQPVESLIEAIEAGITDLGENRVQEAKSHYEMIKQKYPQVAWHMIGHLQRNKVRQALDLFDIIQSVDSERIASAIQAKAKAQAKVPILIEVNTSGEMSKYGVPADSVIEFVKQVSTLPKLQIQGLMTIGPLVSEPEEARPSFVKLRKLFEAIKQLQLPNIEMKYLSMGMSDDFEVAIQEGSNMLRIGRAIFGERGV